MGHYAFLAIAPISALVLLATLAALVPYRRESPGKALIWYFLFAFLALACNIAELVAPTEGLTVFFGRCQYAGLLFLPAAWLAFCLRYTGWSRFSGAAARIASIALPSLMLLVVATDDMHHLVWRSIGFRQVDWMRTVRPSYGPAFWVMAAWSWLLIGAGAFVVLRSFVSSKSPIYRQSLLIAVGALLPAVANAFYLLKLVPGFDKDFTPVGYALSGIFFSFGLYFHRLVWLLPVARGVLMQGMETGVLAIDRHGYVVDHNHSIDRALGLDRILVGKRASDFPRIADLTARLGPSLPASAKVQVGERTYHAKAYPFPGAEGGTVFTLEDVSDAERTGQELEAARLQIARAEKLATIGMLTAGIAHEVNNPLAYVQSDLRSLEQLLGPDAEKPSGEELRVLLSSMREGLDRIQSVVRNLLSLARKESSQGSFTDWDANEAISRTVELCRGDFGHATRVELSLADLPPIRARGRELDQVLLNLIANAAWASKLGGKAGRISIRSSAEGSTCVIEVENDGPPIAESDAERIFEPFFTTKPDGVGTGLGLCVSRDIVEKRHNGKLWLASRDPVRFRIELPSG